MNTPAKQTDQNRRATSDDVRHVLGDLDDTLIVRILAEGPSLRDLTDAAIYARGDGDLIARESRELSAGALAVAELLMELEEALPEDPGPIAR